MGKIMESNVKTENIESKLEIYDDHSDIITTLNFICLYLNDSNKLNSNSSEIIIEESVNQFKKIHYQLDDNELKKHLKSKFFVVNSEWFDPLKIATICVLTANTFNNKLLLPSYSKYNNSEQNITDFVIEKIEIIKKYNSTICSFYHYQKYQKETY